MTLGPSGRGDDGAKVPARMRAPAYDDPPGAATTRRPEGDAGPSETRSAGPAPRLDDPPDARRRHGKQAAACPDPPEHDVGPVRRPQPAPTPKNRYERKARQRFSGSEQQSHDDACGGHQPLHVENDIADLGKLLSLMDPQQIARAHEFGPTLEDYAVNGVPVDCGEDWDKATIRAAVERGPHQSALTPEASACVCSR